MLRHVLPIALASGCGFELTAMVSTDAEPPADVNRQDAPSDAMQPIDAPMIDAPPMIDAFVFTPALCPAEYDRMSASAPGSRFRVINTMAVFSAQHADCNNDHAGWTHLAVFDTQAEAGAVGAMVTSGFFYAGFVQAPNQTAVAAGWRKFTGGPLAVAWSQGGSFNQPEDDEDYVENGEEGLVVANSNGQLYDVSGSSGYRAVCECDGKPIDPAVAPFIP